MKTRAIWANLVQEHISSKQVPSLLERPIEMYSSIELERLFLLWKSAEIGWKRDYDRPARMRSFPCESAEFAHLVDGGRWYLLTTKTGEVTYYDLEAEMISGAQLIPPQYECDDLLVDLDIDTESPVLGFNMAFSTNFVYVYPLNIHSASQIRPCYHAVHIWSISSVLNGSGHIIGLSAARVAAFPHRPMVFIIFDLALCGSHVAFTCYNNEDNESYFVVVNWEQANSNPSYPFRMIATKRTYKRFLGSTYSFGVTRAVYHTFPDRTFMLLSYGFYDREESSFLIKRMPPDMPEAFYPSLSSIDSETARLVLYSKHSKLGYIVDYSLTMS